MAFIYVFMWVLCRFSHVWLFVTLWTVTCQAPLYMGFSRQEYWSGLPHLSPRDLPNPGFKPASLMSPAGQVVSLPLALPGKPRKEYESEKWTCSSLTPVWLFATPWTVVQRVAIPFCRVSYRHNDPIQVLHCTQKGIHGLTNQLFIGKD